ncbi:hypothetical protein DYB34_008654 [Aphanomyces astaci]|uniref:CCR4-Not complex component Not1 C-terminal domain-containing protein n=2 Tax=Aphanomyces astaci TaxID=112090 RepID=A0A3R6W743_APHAT|nr:hypothetical protein DYB34_008654 [Aphanomyces astaci]
MVSFASPLFWQIHYLITNLSKKNFKTNVAELNQLVGLYGEDARVFLLSCLVQEIDFRDTKSHKDSLKVQLLTHELGQASTRPNFTTFLCQAIDGAATSSPITEEFLTQFCKVIKLNLAQQITIGLSFAQSEVRGVALEAIAFLKLKLPELSMAGSKLPPDVLHSLVFLLRNEDAFQSDLAQTDSFLAGIAAVHPNEMSSLEMKPLTLGNLDHVDCMLTSAPLLDSLIDDVVAGCSFYELMEDVGYGCTSSPKVFRSLLAEAGLDHSPSIAPGQVAGMLSMLTRTYKGHQANVELGAVLLSNLPSYEGSVENLQPKLDTWNMDVIADVFQKDYPSIKWLKVQEKLDREDLVVDSPARFRVLLSSFQRISHSKFKLQTLFRPWKYKSVQLAVVKAAIQSPPEVLSFADSVNKLSPFEGADASGVPKNGVWFSLDIVETLISLSETDGYAAVKDLLDAAKTQCPDVLIANVAHATSRWNGLKEEVFCDLFGLYVAGSRANAALIVRHLYTIAPKLVLFACVKVWIAAASNGPGGCLARLFSLLKSTGDAYAAVLHSNYYSLAINMAVVGANHDVLALETWLLERLKTSLLPFATSVIAYLHRHASRAIPKTQLTPATSHMFTLESLGVIAKCLLHVVALPPYLVAEVKTIVVKTTTAQTDDKSVPPPPLPPPTPPPSSSVSVSVEMIEEQANAYFQQIYTSEQNINDVVAMLKRFQSSKDDTERQIFVCMIHNLFDEYRFFPRYPETELRITGVLFGKLIEHQVLPSTFLQTALRLVLESLREPTASKFFFFGACALQQFVPRLRELPAYCMNLGQIAHLQHALPEIMRQVAQVTRNLDTSTSTTSSTSPPDGAVVATATSTTSPKKQPPPSPKIIVAPPPAAPAIMDVGHIFGAEYATLDETIDKEGDDIVEPEPSIVDRLHFIVNNMSISTLEGKLAEVRHLLSPEYFGWFAQYLVGKRIATQPNYHAVYLIFMEKIHQPKLETAIYKTALRHVHRLLVSGTITTNSQQRSLLKNLGSWMGLMTLGRNKALLQRDLDLKELLYVGYETGHLIAVTPLVAKILEGCKKSKVFKPPNPWIMGLIHAMSELYNVPDLKLNLKFEIEVLFKSFKLNVEDQVKANLLHTRGPPPRHGNPDFNIKVDKTTSAPKPSTPKQPPPIASSISSTPPKTPSGPVSESTVIPNLASYVSVNPDLPLHHVNLRRLVPLAVDRAIREVITPVVERSVTIACITTREIILKDFATEMDDVKMRKAAHVMVASLSGSLALITAKEPLRNSIAAHLRALLPASEPHQVDHVVNVCASENTDLGCMLIEKASSEKAMRDIDEALAPAYAARRRGARDVHTPPHVFEGSVSPPPSLPPMFLPSSTGILPLQWMVYEAFQRIPRPTTLNTTESSSLVSGGGLTVQLALERFAGLMEKFEGFVQHIVRQATAAQRDLPPLLSLPHDSDVFAILRDVRSVGQAVKPGLREEACLKIANRIVKCMYELGKGRGDELFLDILVSSLDMLAASCDSLKKEVVRWILSMPVEDKLKLHCEILIALVRLKVVEVSEFDEYLTRNMERTGLAIEFAVYVVRQCLFLEHVILFHQLPLTLEALERIVERHGGGTPGNKNIAILSNLLEQAKKQPQLKKQPVPPPTAPTTKGASIDQAAAFRHTVSNAMEHWVALVSDPSTNHTKMHLQFVSMLKQFGLLKDEDTMGLLFQCAVDICVDVCVKSSSTSTSSTSSKASPLNYTVIDALTQLMVVLIKFLDPPASSPKVMTAAIAAIVHVLVHLHDHPTKPFDQRVFFRLFVNLLKELTVQEPLLDAMQLGILNTFAGALNTLQPAYVPGFVFAWTELVSHRCFMPLLLRARHQRGWQILHRLLVSLLSFLEPFLRVSSIDNPSIAALYKGTMRVVLVLLHDYPDFLSEFYPSFCDTLPPTCVQLRNVILSAFSRTMRLPDPLTPGLQVSQLPEVSVSPRLMPSWGAALAHNNLKEYLDEFLRAPSNRASVFPHDLIAKLHYQSPKEDGHSKYAVPALNAVVLYLGKEAIADMANEVTHKFEQSASMDVFRFLAEEFDMEGRYLYLSAMANHLRYPNSDTHYFSCVLLYLFSHSTSPLVKEQITRVLLERLIANRPHPWGLLVTFIELIRNPTYKFWEQDYLNCSAQIRDVFDDVARTCMGNVPFPQRPAATQIDQSSS